MRLFPQSAMLPGGAPHNNRVTADAPKGAFAVALLFLLCCAAFIGILKYLIPWEYDDLCFMMDWSSHMLDGAPGPGWHDMWDFIVDQTLHANGHLGDKFVLIALMWVPRWLFSLLTGLSAGIICWAGCLAAFGSVRRYPWRWAILTAAFILLLPWAQYQLLVNMTLNYTFGSVFALTAFCMMVRGEQRQSCPRGFLTVAFLAGLLGGWWHEEFSVAFVPGLLLYILLTRGWRRPVTLAVFAGVSTGLLCVLLSPGFWNRAGEFVHDAGLNHTRIPTAVKAVNVMLIIPLLGFVALFWRGLRRWLGGRLTAMLWMFSVAFGITFWLFWNFIPHMRLFWYYDVLAVAFLGMLAQRLLGERPRPWIAPLAWGVMLFICVHIVVTIRWQRIITKEYYDIVTLYRNSPDGVVFYDHHTNGFGPFMTLRKAHIYSFGHEGRDYGVPQFYGDRDHYKFLSIVPTALRNLDPAQVPGTGEVKCYKGYFLFREEQPGKYHRGKYDVVVLCDTPDGEMYAAAVVNPFTDRTGHRWFYIEPDARHLGGRKVLGVKILD